MAKVEVYFEVEADYDNLVEQVTEALMAGFRKQWRQRIVIGSGPDTRPVRIAPLLIKKLTAREREG